jgi:hypothetical protein
MLTQVKVEKVAKLPFAGTKAKIKQWDLKGKYCTPEQFETKALSHLRQVDVTIASLIEGTLVPVTVPVPVDEANITKLERGAINKANNVNKSYEEANAKLRDFLQ